MLQRKQLSNKSREILESAAQRELKRLDNIRISLMGFTRDTKAYKRIAACEADVQAAIRELNRTYLDQFEEGRVANDKDDSYRAQPKKQKQK